MLRMVTRRQDLAHRLSSRWHLIRHPLHLLRMHWVRLRVALLTDHCWSLLVLRLVLRHRRATPLRLLLWTQLTRLYHDGMSLLHHVLRRRSHADARVDWPVHHLTRHTVCRMTEHLRRLTCRRHWSNCSRAALTDSASRRKG